MEWKRRGTAHVLGDDVPHDGAVMSFDMVLTRTTDPDELIPHLFKELDPTLIDRLRPGDFIVAGSNFLSGKPHNSGIIALKALGISLLCESMATKAFNGVVMLAVPLLTQCTGIREMVSNGDELEVDFSAGTVRNVTTGVEKQFPPLPPEVQQIIESGGMQGMLAAHLREHPELAQPYS